MQIFSLRFSAQTRQLPLEKIRPFIDHPSPFSLEVIGKSIESIPKDFSQMKNLASLSLNIGPLESIPFSPEQLKKLKSLKIISSSGGPPLEFGGFENLEKLFLKNLNYNSFPPWVLTSKKLREVTLTQNYLSEIPREIEALTHLKRLNLDNNKIGRLPDTFYQLSQLIHLSLEDNPLEEEVVEKLYQTWKITL